MDIVELLGLLDGVQESGDGWRALCPAHDDQNPSLSIGVGDDDRLLVYCHAGCPTEDVLDALNLTWRDLFPGPARNGHQRPRPARREPLPPWAYGNVWSWWGGHCHVPPDFLRAALPLRVEGHDLLFTFGDRPTCKIRTPGTKGYRWEPRGADPPWLWPLPEDSLPATIWLTEGESDCTVARYLGLAAYAVTKGAAAGLKGEEAAELKRRGVERVVVCFDADDAGRRGARQAAERLHAAGLEAVVLDLAADGVVDPTRGEKDLRDAWTRAGGDGRDAFKARLEEAAAATPAWRPPAEVAEDEADGIGAGGAGGEPSTVERVLAKARGRLQLFHTPSGTPYAAYGPECWHIPSRSLTLWITQLAYRELGTAIGDGTAREVATVLAAQSLFDGPEGAVHVRTAPWQDGIVLDLADRERRVAVIRPSGWTLRPATEVPVRFLRSPGILPLPAPEPGGDLAELWRFVNVPEAARPLVLAWLTAALMPRGPYPHLQLTGPQGCAKSTTARALAALVDPRTPALRTPPSSERDLMIAARGCWLLVFDNISHIPQWLSDALCRLATGGGFATRELYTDADEVLFDAQRPVLSTGITKYITRADLLDRTLTVELPPIADERRQPEAPFWEAFAGAQPRLLGALLDRLAGALRELPNVRLARLPRLADFALLGVAAERGAGEAPAFLAAYKGLRAEAHQVALEASPIGPALLGLLERRGGLCGTAADLLELVRCEAGDPAARRASFPASPRALANELRRLAPALAALGWRVEWARRGKGRARVLDITRDPPPEPPAGSSASSAVAQQPGGHADEMQNTGG